MNDTRRKQLAWVRAILEHRHWSPSRLAREAGIDHSTLSKFLNDADNLARLSTGSVEKIETVAPFPAYQTARAAVPRGVGGHEAVAVNGGYRDQTISDTLSQLTAGRNNLQVWELQSRALEAAGYVPGDVLLVDAAAEPRDGDVVCASQGTNHETLTVFRVLERPFLIAASLNREHFRPILLDGERVEILGVVVTSIRPRLSLLAS